MWSFIDCCTTEEIKALANYQWKHHRKRLEGMNRSPGPPVIFSGSFEPPHYTDETEAGKVMRRVVGEVNPITTEGI
jgi:hypothetical protein